MGRGRSRVPQNHIQNQLAADPGNSLLLGLKVRSDRVPSVLQFLLSGVSGSSGFVCSGFGVARSFASIPCGGTSSAKREKSYEGSDVSEDPSRFGRTGGSIGSLPLRAKIGGTVVAALIAWLVMCAGFIRVLKGRRDIVKGAAYIGLGCGVWLLSSALWLCGG
jgi:hypothetical protein